MQTISQLEEIYFEEIEMTEVKDLFKKGNKNIGVDNKLTSNEFLTEYTSNNIMGNGIVTI